MDDYEEPGLIDGLIKGLLAVAFGAAITIGTAYLLLAFIRFVIGD